MKTDFLSDFESEIDRKCAEIRLIKRKKRLKRINTLFGITLLFMPSVFYLLNINIMYLFIIILVVFTFMIFIKLPDLLNNDYGEVYNG